MSCDTAMPPRSRRSLAARDVSFLEAAAPARWYVGDDPVASAFFSALSATFPLGEKFFIDSVRSFRSVAPPALLAEIDAFVLQEALHTREHLAFNRLVERTGYATVAMTERARAVLAPFRARSALRQLGLTMALEHFTALFAHEVLSNRSRLASAPADVQALWHWHAMEEIEHKAVAFDMFACATQSWRAHRRYAFRARAMIEATCVLLSVVARNMGDLFAQDRLPQPATWRCTLRYVFGRRGVLTAMVPGYLRWFRPGFHPWHIDDAPLAGAVAAELATSARVRKDSPAARAA